ncbi:MAG TPA: hypothetical protein VG713_07275 [Pirellulales bacterium]|nr:hypothetical protein [Pirellulales bacterium]
MTGIFFSGLVVAAMAIAAALWPMPTEAAEPLAMKAKRAAPSLSLAEAQARAEKLVNSQFAKLNGYQPGDMISLGQVEPMFGEFEKLGWSRQQLGEIRERLLPDNAVVLQQLRTPDGLVLMRQSAGINGAYDRLDRMGRMSDGPIMLRRLMTGPDGYRLLDYMVNAPGGTQMGIMLSRDPGAGSFNQPTGRIYTTEQLLAELKKVREPVPPPSAPRWQ